MKQLWRKLSGLLRRNQLESDLREEMETHLAMKSADSADARSARVQFGNSTLLLEDSRAAWGWPLVESWLRDFRYASRSVFGKPAFAATVILTLALGIGSSSTVFSLIDTVLIRPLPYPNTDRLVAVHETRLTEGSAFTPVSPARLADWSTLTSTFESIAGSYLDSLTDTSGLLPERVSGAFVSPRYFSVLGMPAAIGRTFTPSEEQLGGPIAAVLSDGFWRRRFGADPTVLGRTLTLSGTTYSIVGIMPAVFRHPAPTVDVWVPKQATPGLMRVREARFYSAVARLRPGVTRERAQADLLAFQRRLGELYPKTDAGWGVVIEPLKDRIVGKVRLALGLLSGSVSLLLLIACANVACLLLARLNSRAAEIATRCSLGAGRAAIARQLFAEGLVYSLAGGLLGVAAVYGGVAFFKAFLPEVPRIDELTVDARILTLILLVSFLAAILFSLAPILQTFRRDLAGLLVAAGNRIAGGGQRLPRILVAAQLALATALLIGAGLFVRTLTHLEETPLGFQPGSVLTLRIGATYSERPDAVVARHQRTFAAISAIPGVTSVAMTTGLPGVNTTWPREFEIAGRQSADGNLRFATWRVVTSEYFQTVGIPILEGQTCRMNPSSAQPFEIVVNRAFADRYFSGNSPIGNFIQRGIIGNGSARIVGIAANAREDGPTIEPQPLLYACGYLRYFGDSEYLIGTQNPAALAATVRQAIQKIEPTRTVYSVRPLTDALSVSLSPTRVRTMLVSLFSLLSLLLAAVGLYGVMAYMVSQRTREIGLRIALGASKGQIVAGVLRSGGILAAAGTGIGLVFAAAASKLIATLLHGIEPTDAFTYITAAAVLFLVALAACLIPGRRATAIDPSQALRSQ